ncbi:heme ABC transporter ATP-binding protein [Salinisphaera sp. Q1T1-3]|nr:heme ABC transporter ATP-binding protein [Salinisphaera sp. Q1T1-3]
MDQLTVGPAGHERLVDVSLRVAPGELLAVIGANGAGKSSLLQAIVGDVSPVAGRVVFAGRAMDRYPRRERAMRVGVLAQASPLAFPFSVRDVVALARSPHGTGRRVDCEIVEAAAQATDIVALLDRAYTRLSGGEKQRVQLARVLAQVWRAEDAGTRLLLLDEPVAALDIGHQSLVMHTLRRVAATGAAVVFVAHDVSLAAAHADTMLALADGASVACGPPAAVVTAETMTRLYAAETRIITHPTTGTPVVLHG